MSGVNDNGDRLAQLQGVVEGMIRVQENLVRSDQSLRESLSVLVESQQLQSSRLDRLEQTVVDLNRANQVRMTQIEQQIERQQARYEREHLDVMALVRSNRDILAQMQNERDGEP